MACSSCGSGGCGTANKVTKNGVKGCRGNGIGCNKLNSFDWLSNMHFNLPTDCDVVEVRFRNGRKEFFRNEHNLDIVTGDAIVVDVPNGWDLGFVSLQGELVRLQMRKKKVKDDSEIRAILRLADAKDMEKYEQAQARNLPTLFRTRQIIQETNLKMKLSDVEFQADNTKAVFYYSADERVDFRELIKTLAAEFKVRVEMRQISLRQEAGRLGGLGSCGRELCCSTWLTDFKSVATSAARYQNLSLNPAKLSGQCGRLKCCLNYELETYMDALQDIPSVETPLLTQKGKAILSKTDIFKKMMWFAYNNETDWHAVSAERVRHIQELNAQGIMPATLLEDEIEEKVFTPIKSSVLDRIDAQERAEKKARKKQKQIKKRQEQDKSKGQHIPSSPSKQERPLGTTNPQKHSQASQQRKNNHSNLQKSAIQKPQGENEPSSTQVQQSPQGQPKRNKNRRKKNSANKNPQQGGRPASYDAQQ